MIRRALNHILFTHYKVAIRFKISYWYRFRKQYGFDMDHRLTNVVRRALNFSALTKKALMEDNVKKNFAGFIFNSFLCFNLSDRFTLFNDNLVYIQGVERHLQLTREYKFQLVYKRLQLVKDILVTHYSKKSNKSKKHAKKFIKESKKVFDRTRVDDYKQVKS